MDDSKQAKTLMCSLLVELWEKLEKKFRGKGVLFRTIMLSLGRK
jgi:hypothetical protein